MPHSQYVHPRTTVLFLQAGVVLVGFAGYLEGGDPRQAAESGWAAALGMLLVVMAEVVQAAQVST